MRLTSIQLGDIVRVDDGLPYFAHVRERLPRQLRVTPLCGSFSPKPVKAREVVGHWRKR
jgi:hypothetical protein